MDTASFLKQNRNMSLVDERPFSEDEWSHVQRQSFTEKFGPIRVGLTFGGMNDFDGTITRFKNHQNEDWVYFISLKSSESILEMEKQGKYAHCRVDISSNLLDEEGDNDLVVHSEIQIGIISLCKAWLQEWFSDYLSTDVYVV